MLNLGDPLASMFNLGDPLPSMVTKGEDIGSQDGGSSSSPTRTGAGIIGEKRPPEQIDAGEKNVVSTAVACPSCSRVVQTGYFPPPVDEARFPGRKDEEKSGYGPCRA